MMPLCSGNINLLILNKEKEKASDRARKLRKNADLNRIWKGMRHPHFTVISGS